MRACNVPGCERRYQAYGFCKPHYWAERRGEDPYMYKPIARYKTPKERIENNTQQVGDCIEWVSSLNNQGYAVMTNPTPKKGGMVYVHRYVYENAHGELEDGVMVDHICRNRKCVKLEHLRAATRSQNNANLGGASGRSSTGYRNVSFVKRCKRYRVMVMKEGKQYHGGYFSNIEQAKVAAEELRRELFGEFAGRG